MVQLIFFSSQVKQSMVISTKLVYTSCLRVAKRLKTEDLWKLENFTELLPSAQSSSRNKNFVSTGKDLLKNTN